MVIIMSVYHVISGLSMIVVGSFSPTIIRPDWLMKNKIEEPVDESLIDTRLLVPTISDFSISGFNYTTSLENLKLETEVEPLNSVVDRLEKISKLLVYTPITGINLCRYEHLRVENKIHRTNIFRKLAPIQLGENNVKGYNNSQVEPDIDLHSLTLRKDFEKNDVKLTRLVTVEPSLSKPISNDGIYIGVQFMYNNF